LRAGQPEEARDWLIKCLDLCDDVQWLAFRPWPVSLLAEVRLALHEVGNSTIDPPPRLVPLTSLDW
jgi:hypothetical protein